MRILVTGGAGFLGSHLCDRLIADGHHVVCLDNLSTGMLHNLHIDAEFRRKDVADLEPEAFDRIYHLAAPASPPQYQASPLGTIRTIVDGTRAVMDCALQRGGRVLYASTSEVYGDPATTPQPESYMGNVNTWGPRACYDESKRLGETLCYEHRRIYKTDVRVARIFNTYGPRMDPQDGRVVSNFLTQALAGKPLTVYGDGSQTRSFCYVSDMVEALVRLMEVEPAPDGPVNLGNPMEFSIKELSALVGVDLCRSRRFGKVGVSEMCVDLLRHGAVVGGRVYRGSRDDALTDEGLSALRAAVGENGAWTRIISSPLQRCRAFAEELAGRLDVPLAIDARWREIHFGDWEGKSADELLQACPEDVARFWNDPVRHTPPNGETLAAFRVRLHEVWDDMLMRHADEPLLVVTHGGPIRFILGRVASPLPRRSARRWT